MEENIVVGIGEIVVIKDTKKLTCLGLGSCIGVVLFDISNKTCGLAHIMLPDSTEFKGNKENTKMTKYADIAIPRMLKIITDSGCKKENIHAKIAGGANMFQNISNNTMDIGIKNSNSVKKILSDLSIPIDAEDLGGNVGRSINFDVINQQMTIKTINEQKVI